MKSRLSFEMALPLNFQETYIQMVSARLREIGLYLRNCSGKIENIKKLSDSRVQKSKFNTALTYLDLFTQDFITLPILKLYPNLRIFGEENTPIRNISSSGVYCGTVLIDPIDGTSFFCEGDEDYSVLVGFIFEGRSLISLGYYPATDTLYVSSENKLFLENERGEREGISIKDRSFRSDGIKKITAHYRLSHPPYEENFNKLIKQGYQIEYNGKGFGTNLSGALKVISGESLGFICPYTAIHDALVPMSLIKAAGGVVARFSINTKHPFGDKIEDDYFDIENQWEKNFETSPRVRMIGARDKITLDRILSIIK